MALMRMVLGLSDRLVERVVPGADAQAQSCTYFRRFCRCYRGRIYYQNCVSCAGSTGGCSAYCYDRGVCYSV